MADHVIGNYSSGTTKSSSDALSVTSKLAQTPSFQKAISNPVERDVFLKRLESRKEKALASNDKTMYGLLSTMAAKVKSYGTAAGDIYSSVNGFNAIV